MFGNLKNFAFVRNKKQALGFYIVYNLLTVFILAILAVFLLLFVDTEVLLEFTSTFAKILASGITLLLGGLVMHARDFDKPYKYIYIVWVLIAGALTAYIGAVFGLVLIAMLTTRKSASDGLTTVPVSEVHNADTVSQEIKEEFSTF